MADFDPDQYLAEKTASAAFDPDKYLSEKGVAAALPTEQEPSLLSKVGSGVKKWAGDSADRFVHDYVTPVTDLAKSGTPIIPASAIPILGRGVERGAAALRASRGDGDYEDRFNRELGDIDQHSKAYADAHPLVSGVANMAGAATVPIPPTLKAQEGAGLLARAGVGTANAAGRIVTNAALSAGDAAENGGDPAAAAKRATAISGGLEVLGGAGHLAKAQLEAVADTAAAAGRKLSGMAEEKAFRAAVGNQQKAFNEAAAKGQINDRGRDLLDSGVVGFGTSAQQIADRAKIQKSAAAADIQSVLAQADAVHPGAVSGKEIADSIRAQSSKIAGKGNESTVNALEDAAQHYEAMGDHALSAAQVEKNSWQYKFGADLKVNNLVKAAVGDAMENGVTRAATAAKAQAMQGAGEAAQTGTGGASRRGDVESWLTPPGEGALPQEGAPALVEGQAPETQGLPDAYSDAKSRYGTMSAAVKDAQVNANRYQKNNAFSLGDKAAGAAAAALSPGGGLIKAGVGAAAGLANKLVRKRGDSAAAVTLDKVGSMLQSAPEALGKYGPLLQGALERGSLPVTHQLLMQRDPDYKKLVGGGDDQASAAPTTDSIMAMAQGPYAAPLQEAAKRGDRSLAVTHYMLSQTDPKYRQMSDGGDEE